MALVSSFHGAHKLLPYAINWEGPGRKEANHLKLRRHNVWCLTLSTFNLKRDGAYECVSMCSTGKQSLQMCVYVFYRETELTNVCLCILQGNRAYKCLSMYSTGKQSLQMCVYVFHRESESQFAMRTRKGTHTSYQGQYYIGNVNCTGDEQSLSDCTIVTISVTRCSNGHTIVDCTTG